MDGGRRHEVVQENGRRLKLVDPWASKGVGLGFMHFGVEVIADQAGSEFKRWIGGHYEHMHSCNPIWEPNFTVFPDHPISRASNLFKQKMNGISTCGLSVTCQVRKQAKSRD